MRTKAVVPRMLGAAVVAAVVGTAGGITFASASDTSSKAIQVTGYQVVTVHDAMQTDVTVNCPRGKKALSGGAMFTEPYGTFGLIKLSVPVDARKRSGWRTSLGNSFSGAGVAPNGHDFYAVCASV